MKVFILVDGEGGDGKPKMFEYDYPLRRKWAIVSAMNALRAVRPRIEGEILDIRTKRERYS